jgi:hypothetical protein
MGNQLLQRLSGDTVTTELLTAPVEEQRIVERGQHLRWDVYDTHGFCGEALSDGPFVALTQSAERLVCPVCLTILRLYQRSGLWEGYGSAPKR